MISLGEFQGSNDTFPFRIRISQRRRPRRSPRKRIKLQVLFRDHPLLRHNHGILDDPFQFSHIAWPGIGFQSLDGSGTETVYLFSEPQFISPQKEFCQGSDILYRLSQWRLLDDGLAETLQQVMLEGIIVHSLAQIFIGSQHQTHIGLNVLCSANSSESLFLHHSQQHFLHLQR